MELPADLAGYGEERLGKLEVGDLRSECARRGLEVKPQAQKSTCIKLLLDWKAAQGGPKQGLPFDLAHYGKERLEKLDVAVLRTECGLRGIDVKALAQTSTCVAELLKWKASRGGAPAPAKRNPKAEASGPKKKKKVKQEEPRHPREAPRHPAAESQSRHEAAATVRDLKAALEASSEAGAPSRREHVQRRDDYVQAKAVAKTADFETDFQCRQNQGAAETCQIRCAGGCANAVQLCNSLPHCIKVSYNAKRTWATLKRKPTADEIRRHETRKEILNNDKLDLAKTVAREGWESSEVRVTANQATRGALASCPGFYNGNCNERGENLLGRCFCIAGYTGARCEVATAKPPCTNKDDRCFYAEDAGIFVISPSRWRKAQWAEGQLWTQNWNVNARTGDRVDDHMRDFNFYRDVGAPGTNLGNFIEVGAGPWTQSLWMIQQRKFQVENYVIMEPGASSYMNTVETCVYRDGEVRGFEGRTLIINAGAERLDVFDQAFDTLMMINVIEHVENGIRILRNIYNALKPGGLLIFNECVFRVRNFEIPTASTPHATNATCPKKCIIA